MIDLLKKILPAILLSSITVNAAEFRDPTRPAFYQDEASVMRSQPGLSAIFFAPDKKIAVIDGKIVEVGGIINGNKVIAIYPDRVDIEGIGGKSTLTLFATSVKR